MSGYAFGLQHDEARLLGLVMFSDDRLSAEDVGGVVGVSGQAVRKWARDAGAARRNGMDCSALKVACLGCGRDIPRKPRQGADGLCGRCYRARERTGALPPVERRVSAGLTEQLPPVKVDPTFAAQIRAAADAAGESLTGYIRRAVHERALRQAGKALSATARRKG